MLVIMFNEVKKVIKKVTDGGSKKENRQEDSDPQKDNKIDSSPQEDEISKQESENLIPDVDKVVAVSSGKGGVGKSTVAVNLSYSLPGSVGLLDADVHGPDVPRMLGEIERPKATEKEKIIPPEKKGVKAMSLGYLMGEKPAIWRGVMVHKAITQLLNDVEWGDLDYLVVDLPPGTGDAQLSLSQTVPITGSIIVTTPQKLSLDDSLKSVRMFDEVNVEIAGIIENMSEFVCPDCGKKHELFGSGGGERLAKEADSPLLGKIPLDPKTRELSDKGKPIVLENDTPGKQAFIETAEATKKRLEELAKRELPTL